MSAHNAGEIEAELLTLARVGLIPTSVMQAQQKDQRFKALFEYVDAATTADQGEALCELALSAIELLKRQDYRLGGAVLRSYRRLP